VAARKTERTAGAEAEEVGVIILINAQALCVAQRCLRDGKDAGAGDDGARRAAWATKSGGAVDSAPPLFRVRPPSLRLVSKSFTTRLVRRLLSNSFPKFPQDWLFTQQVPEPTSFSVPTMLASGRHRHVNAAWCHWCKQDVNSCSTSARTGASLVAVPVTVLHLPRGARALAPVRSGRPARPRRA
jgi:hypothetical protein